MIALNETNEYAAEIPFTMPLDSDPLTGLTGYTWTLGEVQIKLPGGAWINVAVNKIREVGFGRFAVRLTPSQCVTTGVVAIYAVATGCQPFRGSEIIGTTGGDISQGGTGYLMAYLPDENDPIYGTPASGAFSSLSGTGSGLAGTLPLPLGGGGTSAVAYVAWQDAGYVAIASADVVEFGFGMYGIPVTLTNSVLRGKIYYYLEATGYQRFESYSMVLTAQEIAALPVTAPSTVAALSEPVQVTMLSHTQAAFDRLCEYSKVRLS